MGGNATLNVNGLSAVHQGSGGMASSQPPDVCLTPSPSGPPTPVPYPNLAMSSDLVGGTTTISVDGMPVAIQGSMFVKSSGDEAGVGGGVVSGTFMMEAKFISYSPTVTMDGMPVCRLTDKMLMNKANTACLAGEVQAPLPPDVPSVLVFPPPERPKVCRFEKLAVRCGHDSRKYSVEVERDPGSALQVITSMKPEKIHVSFEGECSIHPMSNGCGKIHVIDAHGKERKVQPDHSFELPLPSFGDSVGGDWYELLKDLLRDDGIPTETLTVYATTCEGSEQEEFNTGDFVNVEVFPEASWKGEIEFGYQHERTKAPTAEKRALLALEKQATWSLKGTIERKVGRFSETFELGTEGAGGMRAPKQTELAFSRTRRFFDKLGALFRSIGAFYATDLNIRWPSVKMGGDVELVEVDGSPRVGRRGTFYLQANPFLGIEIKIDILEWLIVMAGTFAGPPGQGLRDVLGRRQEGPGGRQDDAQDACTSLGPSRPHDGRLRDHGARRAARRETRLRDRPHGRRRRLRRLGLGVRPAPWHRGGSAEGPD